MTPKTHELKIWPRFYDLVESGCKKWELRRYRQHLFEMGDTLILREWCGAKEGYYTGRFLQAKILCVVMGTDIQKIYKDFPKDLCILSIEVEA